MEDKLGRNERSRQQGQEGAAFCPQNLGKQGAEPRPMDVSCSCTGNYVIGSHSLDGPVGRGLCVSRLDKNILTQRFYSSVDIGSEGSPGSSRLPPWYVSVRARSKAGLHGVGWCKDQPHRTEHLTRAQSTPQPSRLIGPAAGRQSRR